MCSLLGNRDVRQFMPLDNEISVVEELVSMLDVFNSATEIVSGEKYPTPGIVHVLHIFANCFPTLWLKLRVTNVSQRELRQPSEKI